MASWGFDPPPPPPPFILRSYPAFGFLTLPMLSLIFPIYYNDKKFHSQNKSNNNTSTKSWNMTGYINIIKRVPSTSAIPNVLYGKCVSGWWHGNINFIITIKSNRKWILIFFRVVRVDRLLGNKLNLTIQLSCLKQMP